MFAIATTTCRRTTRHCPSGAKPSNSLEREDGLLMAWGGPIDPQLLKELHQCLIGNSYIATRATTYERVWGVGGCDTTEILR